MGRILQRADRSRYAITPGAWVDHNGQRLESDMFSALSTGMWKA